MCPTPRGSCWLTVQDHGKLIALKRDSSLLLQIEVESVFEHRFFLLLLISHEIFLFLEIAILIGSSLLSKQGMILWVPQKQKWCWPRGSRSKSVTWLGKLFIQMAIWSLRSPWSLPSFWQQIFSQSIASKLHRLLLDHLVRLDRAPPPQKWSIGWLTCWVLVPWSFFCLLVQINYDL